MLVTTTDEVGSWMDDLAIRFSEITEDRKTGKPAHIDENGVKWNATRIESVTRIPKRTIERMIQSARTSDPTAGPIEPVRSRDQEAIVRSLRNRPEAVAEAIKQLPPERQHEIVRKVIDTPRPAISEADRKANRAIVRDAFEPIRRTLNHMQVVAAGERLADLLRNLPRDLDDEARSEVQASVDDVVLAHMEFMAQYEVQS